MAFLLQLIFLAEAFSPHFLKTYAPTIDYIRYTYVVFEYFLITALIALNGTGLNAAETTLSGISAVTTIYADYLDDGGLGE